MPWEDVAFQSVCTYIGVGLVHNTTEQYLLQCYERYRDIYICRYVYKYRLVSNKDTRFGADVYERIRAMPHTPNQTTIPHIPYPIPHIPYPIPHSIRSLF